MSRKIAVVTGSPRKDGNSDMLAQAFIEGAKSAGHEVVLMEAGRAKINGCLGCFGCFKNEGKCVQNDDMTAFYDDLRDADTLVLCSPIYFYNFTAQIKAFIDRLFCMAAKPFAIKDTALLLCYEDSDTTVPDGIVTSFRAASAYCHWNNLGEILVDSVFKKGDIAGNPALDKARELGASLR